MRKTFILLIALIFPMLASANHYADFYVIPVAGHNNGLFGTVWMSDVAIQNFQATPLRVELVVIEGGEGNPDNVFPLTTPAVADGSVTVPAGGSVLLKDVLNGHRGLNGIQGAILIGADRPFAVTSRTYSMTPSGDTVGQTVLPARDFLENTIGDTDNAGAVAYIPGLIQNARFRTNLGMVAGSTSDSGGAMSISVTLRNAAGATLGTRVFSIPAGTFTQLQFGSLSVANSTYDIGSAEFRITAGDGAVVPYASVIDNATADAVYVAGTFPPNAVRTSTTLSASSTFRRLFEQLRPSKTYRQP